MTTPGRAAVRGRRELLRAVGALSEQPLDAVADSLFLYTPLDRSDHTEVFTFHALPHASAYLGADGMLGGEAAARVAGFWQALGYPPPAAPDHLAALLGLYAGILQQETTGSDPIHRTMFRQGRTALLWEHLLPWTGVFTDLIRHADIAPWDRWADLIEEVLLEEWEGLGESLASLPRHLHDSPPALEASFDMAHLLAPLRTGTPLTRMDLTRAARSLGLGIRLTGRLPTLEALLGQAPREVLAWLISHAGGWEQRHLDRAGPPRINRFWAERAANTKAVLGAILAAT